MSLRDRVRAKVMLFASDFNARDGGMGVRVDRYDLRNPDPVWGFPRRRQVDCRWRVGALYLHYLNLVWEQPWRRFWFC